MEKGKRLEGEISFVQYEKKFVTIDYIHNGKKKQINGSIKEEAQQLLREEKLIPEFHHFREGDQVSFELALSVRGDKMTADRIIFQFNNKLGNLINRSKTNNQFRGYLKMVEENYFIKEVDTYQFFPMRFSPWERRPPANLLNDPFTFQLENTANPDKVYAVLKDRKFVPGYAKALRSFQTKAIVTATVSKIVPHAVYLMLDESGLRVKLPVRAGEEVSEQQGDQVELRITHLGDDKIAVVRA